MTLRLKVGNCYRLRSGAEVEITARTRFASMATDMKTLSKVDVETFHGKIIGTTGERISWNPEGSYGANYRGHQLDIVALLPKRKRK